MQSARTRFYTDFSVLIGNAKSQAAVMVLEPGATEGSADNRHRGADQWLIVMDGLGEVIIEGATTELAYGVVVLIEHGEAHEILNTGQTPLKIISIYAPPAYDTDGELLPAGKP